MAKTLVQHKHCIVCRKVCSVEKETCSEDCETEWNKGQRRRKMYYYVLWAMMAVFVAILIVQLGLGS